MHKVAIAAAALLASAGCSAGEDISAAEREVARFHRLAEAGQADRLYDEAAEDFQRTADPSDFRDLLQVIDERLGDVRSANRQGFHVNYAPGGTVVTLNYDTQFERGRGTERFVYRISDERPLLIGYFVSSPALVARPMAREMERHMRQPQEGEPDEDAHNLVITAPTD